MVSIVPEPAGRTLSRLLLELPAGRSVASKSKTVSEENSSGVYPRCLHIDSLTVSIFPSSEIMQKAIGDLSTQYWVSRSASSARLSRRRAVTRSATSRVRNATARRTPKANFPWVSKTVTGLLRTTLPGGSLSRGMPNRSSWTKSNMGLEVDVSSTGIVDASIAHAGP